MSQTANGLRARRTCERSRDQGCAIVPRFARNPAALSNGELARVGAHATVHHDMLRRRANSAVRSDPRRVLRRPAFTSLL
jgi:hypothetical protein